MRVTIIGSGDAFGSGGRAHSCTLIEHAGGRFLVDCGAAAVPALKARGIGTDSLDAIVITHLHGDHFGGLPFLLLDAEHVARRTRPWLFAGPETLESRLTAATDALYPGFMAKPRGYPLAFHALQPGTASGILPGVSILPLAVEHPSGAPSLGLRVTCEGRTVAFTGDTQWTDAIPALADGADLLIGECYSFEREVPYHIAHRTWVSRRDEVRARRIVLTHLGPDMLSHLDAVTFETAFDGWSVEF